MTASLYQSGSSSAAEGAEEAASNGAVRCGVVAAIPSSTLDRRRLQPRGPFDVRQPPPLSARRHDLEDGDRSPLQRVTDAGLAHLVRRVRIERIEDALPGMVLLDRRKREGHRVGVPVQQYEQRVACDGLTALVDLFDRASRQQ